MPSSQPCEICSSQDVPVPIRCHSGQRRAYGAALRCGPVPLITSTSTGPRCLQGLRAPTAGLGGWSHLENGLALRNVRSGRRAVPGAPSCQGAHARPYEQQWFTARRADAYVLPGVFDRVNGNHLGDVRSHVAPSVKGMEHDTSP